MSHFIIGIAGPPRHGKSTASHMLSSFGFHPDTFAAPMSQFVSSLLGLTHAELEACKDIVHPLFNKTPRYMLQTLGTEWGRQLIDPDFWVKSLLLRNQHRSHLSICGVRFPNEAALVRHYGFLIHVYNPRVTPIPDSHHVAETPVPRLPDDHVIVNDGTLDELYEKLYRLVSPHIELPSDSSFQLSACPSH